MGGEKVLHLVFISADKCRKDLCAFTGINLSIEAHIRLDFYESLLLEIQKLISAPLSPSLFFFSLWFSAAYICSQSQLCSSYRLGGEIETSVPGELTDTYLKQGE